MEIKDLKNLSELCRIEMKETEMKSLAKDFDSILEYVAQIKKVTTNAGENNPTVGIQHNIMRVDKNPHETGKYTKAIVDNMPESEDNYLSVKKIL